MLALLAYAAGFVLALGSVVLCIDAVIRTVSLVPATARQGALRGLIALAAWPAVSGLLHFAAGERITSANLVPDRFVDLLVIWSVWAAICSLIARFETSWNPSPAKQTNSSR